MNRRRDKLAGSDEGNRSSPESSAEAVRAAPAAASWPPGVNPAGTLTRVIEKPDGMRVSLYSTGETVIEKPGEPTITRCPDGRIVRKLEDGRVAESRPKRSIPPGERPINVASCAHEAIGRQLSNFARRPFRLDGRDYASVEGFYQGLKWPDAGRRAEVAQVHGREAKSAGRGAPPSETFEYDGVEMTFGGPQHHALVKRAIRESLLQNPDVLDEFKRTHPRAIIHQTGRPEDPCSAFPGSTFTRILSELRQEFVDQTAGS